MASTRLKFTKEGKPFYEIIVSRGRGQSYLTKRWYIPDGWSDKAVQRELVKVSAAFEMNVKAGLAVSKKEKRAADEAEAAERAKIKTVRQYAEGVWMAGKEASLSENAKDNYQSFLDHHILPVVGDVLMIEVTTAMLAKMILDFQRKGYSHASTIKLYNILNGIFDSAFMDDTIGSNPMAKVRRPSARKDEKSADKTEKSLTIEQLNILIDAAKDESVKWRAYLMLAIDTGARRGELCGLQWKDVDLKENKIVIRRNLQFKPGTGVYEVLPKDGKTRTVDIGDDTVALLKQLKEEQAADCLSKYVFSQDHSPEPMHPTSPTTYFRRLGKRTGIPGLHPHILRHTSASIAITNGGDVASVSARLGHSDPAVTLRMYTHANEESIRRAGQIVRDAIKQKQA